MEPEVVTTVATEIKPNDPNANDSNEEMESAKERIRKEKEALKRQRLEEEETKKQQEKERLLHMSPTKHKEQAGGGEPADLETRKRRETVKKVTWKIIYCFW